MKICDINHTEICYETEICPVCILIEELNRIDDELTQTKANLEELQSIVNGAMGD